jgi:hypothetical protein
MTAPVAAIVVPVTIVIATRTPEVQASPSRPATVPTSVTRIMAINKLATLPVEVVKTATPATPPASLAQRLRRRSQ